VGEGLSPTGDKLKSQRGNRKVMGRGFEGEGAGGELRILSERAREQVLRDRALLEDLALALALFEPEERGEAEGERREKGKEAPRPEPRS
jgi:hypothetical protein